MAEVKMNKEQALAKRETPASIGFFRPTFPFSRYFGGEPFGLLRELNEEMDRAFRGFAPASSWNPGPRPWMSSNATATWWSPRNSLV